MFREHVPETCFGDMFWEQIETVFVVLTEYEGICKFDRAVGDEESVFGGGREVYSD